MNFKIENLGTGVEGGFIQTDKFKSTLLSFCFFIKNSEKTASFALFSEISTNVCDEYPTIRKLKKKLDELYGATLQTRMDKVGDMIKVEFAISVIADKYTLDKEEVGEQAAKLLISLLFEPSIENGSFKQVDVERDRKVMIDAIESEINDKRLYAARRALALMCPNEPVSLPKYGTAEQMSKVSSDDLVDAWNYLLHNAFVRVNYVGSEYPNEIFALVSNKFAAIDRISKKEFVTDKHICSKEVNIHNESIEANQSKLFMGFTFDSTECIVDNCIASMFIGIFSGGTFSKCFKIVREKLSLCYYCAPSLLRQKGIFFVDCGIDNANYEKAKNAIIEQLDEIKKGNVTDDEFDAEILAIKSSLNSVSDSVEALNGWLKGNIFRDEKYNDINEHFEIINNISKQDIIDFAKTVKLDTVYLLCGTQEAE